MAIIEFNTDNLDEREAQGLVALIGSYFPTALRQPQANAVLTGLANLGELGGTQHAPTPTAAEAFKNPTEVFTPPPQVAAGAASAEAPAPVVAPAVVGRDLDKDGLPWDVRIHSTPAKKNSDGSWRAKRGLNNPDFVAGVVAELKAVMAAPAIPQPPAAPSPVPVPPVAPQPPASAESAALAPTASQAPAASSPQPLSPVPAPPTPQDVALQQALADPTAAAPPPPGVQFAAIMTKVNAMEAAQTLTPETRDQALASVGLANLRDLFQRTDLIPAFEAALTALAG